MAFLRKSEGRKEGGHQDPTCARTFHTHCILLHFTSSSSLGGGQHGLHGSERGSPSPEATQQCQWLERPAPPSSVLHPLLQLWVSWPCAQIFPSREHLLLLSLWPRNPEASAKRAEVTCHSRREHFLSSSLRHTWCMVASTCRSLVPHWLLTRETYSRGGAGGERERGRGRGMEGERAVSTGTGGPLVTATEGL